MDKKNMSEQDMNIGALLKCRHMYAGGWRELSRSENGGFSLHQIPLQATPTHSFHSFHLDREFFMICLGFFYELQLT